MIKQKGYEPILKKAFDFFQKNKYVLMVLAVGLLLILWPSGETAAMHGTDSESGMAENDFSVTEQEKRLEEMLSRVEGAGEVRVLLSVLSSGERIVARETEMREYADLYGEEKTEETESSETVVVVTSGQEETPVTLQYLYPTYLGAVIVAEGAENSSVRLALTNAVASATGLNTDRITVLKMKEN